MFSKYSRIVTMTSLPVGAVYLFTRQYPFSSSTNVKVAPYGSWESPLSSADMVSSSTSLLDLQMYNDNLYFVEMRPNERGRMCIVEHNWSTNELMDMTPTDINSRSRVHEYGGGSYCILPNTSDENHIVTCNFKDQKLYDCISKNSQKEKQQQQQQRPVTELMPHKNGLWKYSDMISVPDGNNNNSNNNNNTVICVREEDIAKERQPSDNVNNLVAIDLNSGKQDIICQGHNFYLSPRVDKNGKYLAYIAWDFPNMPWDKTKLYLRGLNTNGDYSKLAKDSISASSREHVLVDSNASILAPTWDLNGENLYYISDESGFWNIYRYNIKSRKKQNICNNMKAEFGRAAWSTRKTLFDFASNNSILAAAIDAHTGRSKLLNIVLNGEGGNAKTTKILELQLDHEILADIDEIAIDREKQVLYILGGSPTNPKSIFSINFTLDANSNSIKLDKNSTTVIKSSDSSGTIDRDYISVPKHIRYPTDSIEEESDSEQEREYSYAYVYYPKNPKFKANDDELPPLLVIAHGGPTSRRSDIYQQLVQFYTTRGWVVADVNYRGSTGYGTEYRNKLRANWGIYDVMDVSNIAKYLVNEKKVDANKLCIRGGSAGGYTVLATLTSDVYNNIFSVGCSRYGVADLALLDAETHKFESQYLDMLLCKMDKNGDKIDLSDKKERYLDRSPINFVNRLNIPVIFLQGKEDKIVLPNQAEMMFKALKDSNITCSLEMFDGEQHGFRQKENIIKAIDYEYTFYCKILGIPLSQSDEKNMQKPNIEWAQKKPN